MPHRSRVISFTAAVLFAAISLLRGGFALAQPQAVPAQPAGDVRSLGLFPASGAAGICPDTPLRITFKSAPALSLAGKIQIFDATTNTAVETISVNSRTATKTIGGMGDFNYFPVIVTGNEAAIYPRSGALAYGKKYYVTVAPGVFKDESAAFSGIAGPAAWTFTTKPASPATLTKKLTVAADGSGDFCSIQGALDFIPDSNTAPITIFVRKGIYNEIIFFTNKHSITIVGEDRKQTIVQYANNANFNGTGGNPFAGTNPNPSTQPVQGGAIYHRGLFMAHRVNDLTIANLTLHNTTRQGGSQAEAIILNGSTTARAILKDVDFIGFQDTLQINGQAFISNCYIEGDVDFLWGTGPCFFENCQCNALRSNAYYTQIRNPPTNHGFVFKTCVFDGAPDVRGNFLSRIEPGRFPNSEVVLLDCVLTGAVGDVAWTLQNGRDAPNVHFWEFNSHMADGKPVDASKRSSIYKQLKLPDDLSIIADYSNPKFVLGNDWDPKHARIFANPNQ